MPVPDYIGSIRQRVAADSSDSWTVSASVDAVVARYSASGKTYIADEAFWKTAFTDEDPPLSVYLMWSGYKLGYLMRSWSSRATDCLLGVYSSGEFGKWNNFPYFQDPDSVAFRSAALMFTTKRERCRGTWKITYNDISLVDESCTGLLMTQRFLTDDEAILPMEVLPFLAQALWQYAEDRRTSPWRLPTFAVSVATMYWARKVEFNRNDTTDRNFYYYATDESIISSRSTLNAHLLLYVVLALQPVLMILMFLSVTLLFSTPIDRGFGLVAILASIDQDNLRVVQGAGLSGELKQPVRLDIAVRQGKRDNQGHTMGRIVYTIGYERRNTPPLERGVEYS